MFIDWISQMLPLMDKPEGEAVEGILHSIAVDYPQVEPLLTALCVCGYTYMYDNVWSPLHRQYVTPSRSAPMTSNVMTLQRERRD